MNVKRKWTDRSLCIDCVFFLAACDVDQVLYGVVDMGHSTSGWQVGQLQGS